jgi:hypothetical protein
VVFADAVERLVVRRERVCASAAVDNNKRQSRTRIVFIIRPPRYLMTISLRHLQGGSQAVQSKLVVSDSEKLVLSGKTIHENTPSGVILLRVICVISWIVLIRAQ